MAFEGKIAEAEISRDQVIAKYASLTGKEVDVANFRYAVVKDGEKPEVMNVMDPGSIIFFTIVGIAIVGGFVEIIRPHSSDWNMDTGERIDKD